MHKLSVQAPPKLTVEKYLVEIAKYYNVDYEPDTQVLGQDEAYAAEALIELGPGAAPPIPNKSDLAMAPQIPPGAQPTTPFQYPAPGGCRTASTPQLPIPTCWSSSISTSRFRRSTLSTSRCYWRCYGIPTTRWCHGWPFAIPTGKQARHEQRVSI